MDETAPALVVIAGFNSCTRFDKVTFVLFMPVGRTEVTLVWNTLFVSLLTYLFFASSVTFQNTSVTGGCFTLSVVLLIVLLTTFT